MNLLKRIPVWVICPLIACTFTLASPAQDLGNNRYATAADAAAWPGSVNVGDYLIVKANNDGNTSVYANQNNGMKIELEVGERILIHANVYRRIFIDGQYCQGTAAVPTVVTNFGGQVRWGDNPNANGARTFELSGFKHVHLTGKYDAAAKTGDPGFRGHNGGANFATGDYYEKYGFWGNQRWSGERQVNPEEANTVRISGFDTCKVDYVAAWGGGFAGFNIKTDRSTAAAQALARNVVVDVQDCFTGFQSGEGFYISTTQGTVGQDYTKLTFRNNILMFTGAEAIQTDLLLGGSVIENNVVVGSGTFFRAPFKSGRDQEGLHQLSFMEGGITVRKNVLLGGANNPQGVRWKTADAGRLNPYNTSPVLLENNHVGYTRSNISYIWEGDGTNPYTFQNNVYGPMAYPIGNDAYIDTPADEPPAALHIAASVTPMNILNNRFSHDRWAIGRKLGPLTATGNVYATPPLVKFKDLGFPIGTDIRRITPWVPVYKNCDKTGQFVPYQAGDVVFTYDGTVNGGTRFYECIATHTTASTTATPGSTPGLWAPIATWGSRPMPPLDVRFMANSYHNYRGMGLTYNEANTTSSDTTAPVITLVGGDMSVPQGKPFTDPGYKATDNRDGTITANVVATWVGPAVDTSVPGEYYRAYTVADAAGNVCQPTSRVVTVSAPGVAVSRRVQLNMHQNSGNTGHTTLPGWTNLANNTTGLLNNATTYTNLFDTANVDTGWDLAIDDIDGVSEHAGAERASAGVEIMEFPAPVTKHGLKIRNRMGEDSCTLRLTGLNPAKHYDFRYTGYLAATSSIIDSEAEITDAATGRRDTITVKGNTSQVGEVRNVQPNAAGEANLVLTTETPWGQPNISAFILREKSGFGYSTPISEWRLDENTGGTAVDFMGLSNGSRNGYNWNASGKFNWAAILDGTDDWVAIPSQAAYSGQQLSISMWVKPAQVDSAERGLISKRVGANNQTSFSVLTYTSGRLFVDIGSGSGSTSTRYDSGYALPTANVWYHVVMVFDGSLAANRLKLYVNGGMPKYQVQTAESTILNTTAPLYIGSLNALNGTSFKGMIDQVKLYNQALTESDIRLLGQY